MKLPFPDWQMAKLAIESYREDGVYGKLGYDPEAGTWYAEFDDNQYNQYMANLSQQHNIVLNEFGSIDWHDATNIQGSALEPPKENENRLAIYLIHPRCKTAKGFKVSAGMTELMQRRTQFMYIGSTCMSCGERTLVVITWEDVKPKKGGSYD